MKRGRKRGGAKTVHDFDALTPVPAVAPDSTEAMDRTFREFAARLNERGAVPAAAMSDADTAPLFLDDVTAVDIDLSDLEVAS